MCQLCAALTFLCVGEDTSEKMALWPLIKSNVREEDGSEGRSSSEAWCCGPCNLETFCVAMKENVS